ncbi:hypothetical protein P8A21_39950 (plasmid) [Streptomyces poriferorum]|uniref:hypothetical protein n=1 Tax=Streptomyces poriferorum TaxID=2798799 RepID=UPI00273DCE59|nr:hypothetical protein [Streptomyces sp. Alt1]WLQ53719.1 hypothetical protein P8A21_39950 [Streptomyces sp. Alt1]
MKRRFKSVAVATIATLALAGCGGSGKSSTEGSIHPSDGSSTGSSGHAWDPSVPYRLKMPAAVLNGAFTEADHSEPDQGIASMLSGQIETGISAFAAYRPADRTSDTSGPVLAVTGVYGTVLSPVDARDQFLKILDSRTSDPEGRSTVIIGPRTVIPQGSSEPVSCRIVQETDQFGTTWQPSCSWADGSAVVEVTQSVQSNKNPAAFGLEAFAAKTAIIRNEVRSPAAP